MENLFIQETPKSPLIDFNFKKGVLKMKGRSIPENSFQFYKPIIEAMDQYVNAPLPSTSVFLHLEYFSTSSSKCILDVFKRLESIHKNGHEVTITWYYEDKDENMRDAGVDYEAIVNIPFKIEQLEG